jgi:hypothetical protein
MTEFKFSPQTSQFLQRKKTAIWIPMTPLILGAIPKFMFHGTFSTMFLSTADFCYRKRDFLCIIYAATAPNPSNISNFDRSKNFQRFAVKNVSILANHMVEDSEKTDDPFPMTALDFIIEKGENIFALCQSALFWM